MSGHLPPDPPASNHPVLRKLREDVAAALQKASDYRFLYGETARALAEQRAYCAEHHTEKGDSPQ